MFFHRRAEMSHVVAHNRSTRRTFRKSNNHEGTSRWACIRAEFAGGIASKGCLPTSLWESCTTPKQKYTASFFCSNYVGTDVLSHVISVYFFKNDGSRDCVDEDRWRRYCTSCSGWSTYPLFFFHVWSSSGLLELSAREWTTLDAWGLDPVRKQHNALVSGAFSYGHLLRRNWLGDITSGARAQLIESNRRKKKSNTNNKINMIYSWTWLPRHCFTSLKRMASSFRTMSFATSKCPSVRLFEAETVSSRCRRNDVDILKRTHGGP